MGTNKLSGAIPTWSNSLVHIDLSSNLFTKLPKISANSALEYLYACTDCLLRLSVVIDCLID